MFYETKIKQFVFFFLQLGSLPRSSYIFETRNVLRVSMLFKILGIVVKMVKYDVDLL